ncbi:MAG: hypothetical protein JXQ30_03065 [Spirochaetes bacterium]|nr:hypothetical protein [Spirochaetota bacterium]
MTHSRLVQRTVMTALCTVLAATAVVSADTYIQDEVTGYDSKGKVEELVIEPSFVILSRDTLYHHETIEVLIESELYLDPDSVTMRVYNGEQSIPCLGGEKELPFQEQIRRNGRYRYRAVFLPPWNQPDGQYEIRLEYGGNRMVTGKPILFTMKRRVPPELHGLSVVDLEMNGSILTKNVTGPGGRKKGYLSLLDWAQYMGADALWILAGETTTFPERVASDTVRNAPWWDAGPLENLDLLKTRALDYGMDTGAYIMCFYVPGSRGVPSRYEPGIGYNVETDRLYRSRFISLGCEQRIQDIVELVRTFQNDPHIRYIGFDFIRTGRGDGYELAPLMVRETGIRTPTEWDRMSGPEQSRWLARKIEVEKDPIVLEKWRWWRARTAARIIERIISEAHVTKPVWVYTLGWDHGREHGQDPVMFFDAGVTIDAVMLYESDRFQFPRMLDQWKRYMKAGQGNILIGNCVDSRLLDSESLSPPQELYRRNTAGYEGILKGGVASGIFFHDLSRAVWGRKGGFFMLDFAVAHGSSVYHLLRESGGTDLVVDMTGGERSRYIVLKNNGMAEIKNVVIEAYTWEGGNTVPAAYDAPLFPVVVPKIPQFGSVRIEIRSETPVQKPLVFLVAIDGGKRYYVMDMK